MEILELITDAVFGIFAAIGEILSSIPSLWGNKS